MNYSYQIYFFYPFFLKYSGCTSISPPPPQKKRSLKNNQTKKRRDYITESDDED